jgi:hypothetical protein
MFGQEVEVSRVSWKFRDGSLQHEIRCSQCGALMEYRQPNFEGLSEKQILKIGSWTREQKAEYFKKNNITEC